MNSKEKDPRTYAIISAAMEVHRELGPGFLEAVYQEALSLEFKSRGIPYSRETDHPVYYKEILLSTGYRSDFTCFNNVIVETKALKQLSRIEEAQIINYLKATKHNIGLLLNFGSRSLEFKRFVQTGNNITSQDLE